MSATNNGKDLLAAALAYAQRGWHVLPLHTPNGSGCSCGRSGCKNIGKHPRTLHGVKDATTDMATIRKWWNKWPDANIGIATGLVSGVDVLDVDPRHGGLESLQHLEDKHGVLPTGPLVQSGGDGYHYYFLAPDFRVRNAVAIADGIDIRGDGGYIVAPPSRHASGRTYRFTEGGDLHDRSFPPMPDWVVALLVTSHPKNTDDDLQGTRVREGGRNSYLVSLAGSMRQRGMDCKAILAALRVENAEKCDPALPESELAAIAKSIARYTVGPTTPLDVGLVRELADAIKSGEHFAQDSGGKLYRFTDGVYKPDGVAKVRLAVKKLLEEWNQSSKWSSARSEEVAEYVRLDAASLWERPPLSVVNVQNGLLDVEAGRLLPHTPKHLCSVRLPVTFDPSATCPHWEEFVEQVFPTDAQELAWQLIAWLMRPDVSFQKAMLLQGEGGNGKSTYLAGVIAFLGHPNVSAVSLHKLESDRFAVARLVGKLANICPDLPSSHLAETSTFKALTGGDPVPAEYKYKDSFDFVPFARLVFSANYLPRSRDSSHAFFRRWYVVPFTRVFEGGDEIPRTEMDARLANPRELSGVLNKALQALKQIQESKGLMESVSMSAAANEFREITDPLAAWLNSSTIENGDVFVTKKDLRSAYNSKAEATGQPPMTETGFGLALRRLRPNLKEAQRTVAGKKEWVWLGLGLRAGED